MNQRPAPSRVHLVDRLRGLVIVLMALDHARGFFQPAGVDPQHLPTTTPLFFFIRWVTHLCAPTFLLLAGVSIWLAARTAHPATLRGHVARRGLLLMFLETTWVSFSWTFGWDVTYLGVLWAIGGAMVLTSLCIGRDPRWVGALGVGLTCLFATWTTPSGIVGLLCAPQRVHLLGHPIQSVYVIAPWFAVMAFGYGLGAVFERPQRYRSPAAIGMVLMLIFAICRYLNGWGDPAPWEHQDVAWKTTLDALDPSKYPPSFSFLCMTLGVSLALTPLLERLGNGLGDRLEHYGKAALFFYLLHLPMLHIAGSIYASVLYDQTSIPKGVALSIPLIATAWVGVLLALYPVCLWWIDFKRRHRKQWPWLTYL